MNSQSTAGSPDSPVEVAPMSAGRLAAAFAKLLGGGPAEMPVGEHEQPSTRLDPPEDVPGVSPLMVFEGLLFVGHPGGEPVTVEQAGAVLRGLTASDLEQLAERLNALYRSQHRPYLIERKADGYRLALSASFCRLRDQMQSRTRRARLSRAALDVLSLVAYRGPLTAEQIQEGCGASSASVVRQLVRRDLLAVVRPGARGAARVYRTTDRMLQVFHLGSLAELPQSRDWEPSDQAP
jgi:segregation and condensation protein B